MIHRLRKVIDGLYRGSAPSPKDVEWLKDNFGINKIVSLDRISGERISNICKLLNIKQEKFYLNGSKSSLLKLLSQNIKSLLLDDGPTYVHCYEGKDRTSLLIGLFKCKYLGESSESVIEEAKHLGFGIGVDPEITQLYEKLIKSCKPKDINKADIVSEEREYKQDNRSTTITDNIPLSFAPYLEITRQMPFNAVYKGIDEQSPTRENYYQYKHPKELSDEEEHLPMVGLYDNDTGLRSGPSHPVGGFITE